MKADELPLPHQIFPPGLKSYRDLPIRMAEFGACHRNEPLRRAARHHAGAPLPRTTPISSAPRIRSSPRPRPFCDLLLSVYKDFGFTDVRAKFSDRPEKRAGADGCDLGQGGEGRRCDDGGLAFTLNPGEGAFMVRLELS